MDEHAAQLIDIEAKITNIQIAVDTLTDTMLEALEKLQSFLLDGDTESATDLLESLIEQVKTITE